MERLPGHQAGNSYHCDADPNTAVVSLIGHICIACFTFNLLYGDPIQFSLWVPAWEGEEAWIGSTLRSGSHTRARLRPGSGLGQGWVRAGSGPGKGGGTAP